MSSGRADLEALRKDALEVFTDPEERAQALRDLDTLEKMRAEHERMRAALARTAQAEKAAEKRWLVITLVLCVLVPVAAAIWLSYEAAISTAAVCAVVAGIALQVLKDSRKGPPRRTATTSADLASIPVDPLAEAEVYLAYGRKEQAIGVLEQGLAREPRRKDLSEKLAQLRQR
jgi:Tfp pilus assembly protein FimV